MKLGYVCTNYNNSHFTVDAVRSLVASSDGSHELRIVVVDNLSTPEHRTTLRALVAEFSCVDLVLNDENVGYFPGLNCGIRHMRSSYPDFQYLIIGNNDLVFAPSFCTQVDESRSLLDSHAVVSPDIITLDGDHQNPHVIRTISKMREFVYDLYYSNYRLAQLILWLARKSKRLTDRSDELYYKKAQFIYQGHGSCYLIGPKFFSHFDELWAPTFLMGEEYFLSKQLSDSGMQVYYNPTIQVTHCWHGSLQSIPSRKLWQIAREAHLVYRKYINPFKKL